MRPTGRAGRSCAAGCAKRDGGPSTRAAPVRRARHLSSDPVDAARPSCTRSPCARSASARRRRTRLPQHGHRRNAEREFYVSHAHLSLARAGHERDGASRSLRRPQARARSSRRARAVSDPAADGASRAMFVRGRPTTNSLDDASGEVPRAHGLDRRARRRRGESLRCAISARRCSAFGTTPRPPSERMTPRRPRSDARFREPFHG